MLPKLIIRDDRRDNLQLSEDTGDEDAPIAVLLFTPDMEQLMEHHHIEVSVERARATYDWLGTFLAKHESKTTPAEHQGLEAERRSRIDGVESRMDADHLVVVMACRDHILRAARETVLKDDRDMLVAALALALESARQPSTEPS